MILNVDRVIIGAGPAGCISAFQLADTQLKIAVIDKATSPWKGNDHAPETD